MNGHHPADFAWTMLYLTLSLDLIQFRIFHTCKDGQSNIKKEKLLLMTLFNIRFKFRVVKLACCWYSKEIGTQWFSETQGYISTHGVLTSDCVPIPSTQIGKLEPEYLLAIRTWNFSVVNPVKILFLWFTPFYFIQINLEIMDKSKWEILY